MNEPMQPLLLAGAFGLLYFLPGHALCKITTAARDRSPFRACAENYVVGVGLFGLVSLGAHALGVSLSMFLAAYVGLVVVASALWVARVVRRSRRTSRAPRKAPLPRDAGAAATLIAIVVATLMVFGGNQGIGFDEWSHLGVQDELLTSDGLYAPNAFVPVIRDDGAVVTTYHDWYDAHLAAIGRVTGLPQGKVLFGATFIFAGLILAAAMTLAEVIVPGRWAAAAGCLLYLVVSGGNLVRAANTRNVATIALLLGMAQLLRWLQAADRRDLWLAATSVAVAIGIHNFYLVVYLNIVLMLALAGGALNGPRWALAKFTPLLVALLVLIAPYAALKAPVLTEKLAYSLSRGLPSDVATPPTSALPDTGGQADAPTPSAAGGVSNVRGVEGAGGRLFLALIALALVALLRSAKGLMAESQAAFLVAATFAPAVLEQTPAVALGFARMLRPERIGRVWPDEIFLPFLLLLLTVAGSRCIRVRRFATGTVVGLALVVLLPAAATQAAANVSYPGRIAAHHTRAVAVIRELHDLDAAMERSVGCLVSAPPREAFVLKLQVGRSPLYASPRGRLAGAEGEYRTYYRPELGFANQELLSARTTLYDTVRLARDHGVCYVLTPNGPAGLPDKFEQNPIAFRLVAATRTFKLFELRPEAEVRVLESLQVIYDSGVEQENAARALLASQGLRAFDGQAGEKLFDEAVGQVRARLARLTARSSARGASGDWRLRNEVRSTAGYLRDALGGTPRAEVVGLSDVLGRFEAKDGRARTAARDPALEHPSCVVPAGTANVPPTAAAALLSNGLNTRQDNHVLSWPRRDLLRIDCSLAREVWLEQVRVQADPGAELFSLHLIEVAAGFDKDLTQVVSVLRTTPGRDEFAARDSLTAIEHTVPVRRMVRFVTLWFHGDPSRGYLRLGELIFE